MSSKLSHRTVLLVGCLAFLPSCAYVDRTLLKPSAEMSRVTPLFRTPECEKYTSPDPDSYSPDQWHNPFVKNSCEDQTLSLTLDQGYSERCGAVTDQRKLKECSAYLMRTSDEICNIHLSRIFGDRAVSNVALGTLAAGAGIAGGLVSGISAANALSGTAGFLTGSRALMNEEVYRNYIAEAIIKEIMGNRERHAGVIRKGLDLAPGSEIKIDGVEQLMQQMTVYHNECSFYAGLTSLAAKAGSQDPKKLTAPDAQMDLQKQIDAANTQLASLKAKLDATKKPKEKKAIQTQIDGLASQIKALETAKSVLAKPGG